MSAQEFKVGDRVKCREGTHDFEIFGTRVGAVTPPDPKYPDLIHVLFVEGTIPSIYAIEPSNLEHAT